jgi:hypothetical protein
MPINTQHRNPYPFHRAALAPVLPGATDADLERSCTTAKTLGEVVFAEFLCQQGLAALWDERIECYPDELPITKDFKDLIHQARLHDTGAYLIQRHSLGRVREILDEAGVVHVVTKGAHTREVYYATPALRPATDIDVLVRPQDKLQAIRAFQAQGFAFYGEPETISHEASLLKGKTSIDLHWDILRPGRTRQNMVDALLNSRVDNDSHWSMNTAGALFMMLAHPVFAKYTTTPHATLVRLVDLALLLDVQPEAASEAEALLDMAGLKTAGWITAQWLHLLTGNRGAIKLATALSPGPVRQWWLHSWLNKNRSSQLNSWPWAIQLAFTLPAHDRWSDALRATRLARQCRKDGAKTLELLEQQLA